MKHLYLHKYNTEKKKKSPNIDTRKNESLCKTERTILNK